MTIRFGVIGTNWITDNFLESALLLEDFALTAVYSRTEERGREFAQKYNVETIFTDLTEMAASDLIDAVYIASPNSHHAEQAILLMEHGKHVICEKPLASNAIEVKKMIQTAEKHSVILMEALKSVYVPSFQAIKENLPKLGKIRRYVASYCQYSSRYDAYKSGTVLNAFNPAFSNGAIMDIGVYCIYPLIELFGKPNTIKATGILLESGVDGEGSVLLQYKDFEAVVMYSKITNSSLPGEIQGEDATLIFDKVNVPEIVHIRDRNGESIKISTVAAHPPMYYEAQYFINSIQNKTFAESHKRMEISLVVTEVLDEARKQIGLVFPADNKEEG